MGNKASSTNRRNKQGFLLNAADSTRTALTAPCENDEPQSFKPSSNNMSILKEYDSLDEKNSEYRQHRANSGCWNV